MLFEKMIEVVDAAPHGAALNMAIDEVLLRGAGEPLLRVYRWERPAVSFGYFEKFSELGAFTEDVELVRRWTGGGVVAHGEDVTYTLVIPMTDVFARLSAQESYQQIHACVATALHSCGVETSLAPATAEKTSSGCFENPAEADVLAGERKIAGAAQRRTRWGLLHQGSIQGVALAKEFPRGLGRAFAKEVLRRELTPEELAAAQRLTLEKYASDSWLRRF